VTDEVEAIMPEAVSIDSEGYKQVNYAMWGNKDLVELTVLGPRNQAPCGAVPFHTWDLPEGSVWTAFYRTSSGFLLRFPDLADFEVSVDGRYVTCAPAPSASNATAEHLYLNQVHPLALSKLGKLVFHGSAVEIGVGAIAFLAQSGRGKSTLAADFAARGHRFLTDDGLIVEPVDGVYQVLPSHPSLRLWHDSQERLLRGGVETAPALSYASKVRFVAGTRITHCDEPRPLRTAYFLGNGSATEITFRRLTEPETLLAWARHSFLLDVDDPILISAHFDGIATLANHLVCYDLDYPRHYDDLERLLEAVVAHATHLGEPLCT
jgi:hypothetical protein